MAESYRQHGIHRLHWKYGPNWTDRNYGRCRPNGTNIHDNRMDRVDRVHWAYWLHGSDGRNRSHRMDGYSRCNGVDRSNRPYWLHGI